MIQLLRKLFRIPGKPHSLPMSFTETDPDVYTWEKWKVDAKREYPVRFFLSETLPLLISVHITMPLDRFLYWIRSHTYRRYHKLDLRYQEYQWGYRDPVDQLRYAMIKVFMNYVNEILNIASFCNKNLPENKIQALSIYIKTLYNDIGLYENEVQHHKECLEVLIYWEVGRAKLIKELDEVIGMRYDSKTAILNAEDDKYLNKILEMRHWMWT